MDLMEIILHHASCASCQKLHLQKEPKSPKRASVPCPAYEAGGRLAGLTLL